MNGLAPQIARLGAAARFLLAGGLNTVLTYLLYLALLRWMSAVWSYVMAFVLGILLSYLLSRYWVFVQAPARVWHAIWVPVIHLAQLALGSFIVWVSVQFFALPPFAAPLLATGLMFPLVFMAQRRVFSGAASVSQARDAT